MSQVIKNCTTKLASTSTSTVGPPKTTKPSCVAELFCSQSEIITENKYPTTKSPTKRNLSPATLLSPSVGAATSNAGFVSPSPSSMTKQLLVKLTRTTSAASVESGRKVSSTMPSFKIMTYQNIIALLTVLVCGLVTVNGLKCYMCGQYNEGVGSITPCLNYSEQYAHLYLKECSKKSEKYCVVSGTKSSLN